ncbi:MAG: TlpA family protein disulfide reductase [Flavobacterium sp.]|nr:MAG: TlpA family protein disulfide reductase [Flavobacterium sp.]
MKNIIICFLLAIVGCQAQETVKISGMIKNPNSDKVTISGKNLKQVIPVAKDGTFKADFAVEDGIYQFFDGAEYSEMYLRNGFDLTMSLDAKKFDETMSYKGKGANENNFLAKKILDEETFQDKYMAVKDKPEEAQKLLMAYAEEMNKKMAAPELDPGLRKAFEQQAKEQSEKQAEQMAAMEAQAKANSKLNGTVSPGFDYENHKGGKTKLADLKGKYVYIDNWATWCGPCRGEIPSLQKVEEHFKGKNIEFVSISVDVKKDYDKWRKFVTDKSLGGMQLIADNDWNSDFMKAYGVMSIPRFILIGPDGKIIDSDAKRPSDPALTAQLETLLK